MLLIINSFLYPVKLCSYFFPLQTTKFHYLGTTAQLFKYLDSMYVTILLGPIA